jgi:hypothetical protein
MRLNIQESTNVRSWTVKCNSSIRHSLTCAFIILQRCHRYTMVWPYFLKSRIASAAFINRQIGSSRRYGYPPRTAHFVRAYKQVTTSANVDRTHRFFLSQLSDSDGSLGSHCKMNYLCVGVSVSLWASEWISTTCRAQPEALSVSRVFWSSVLKGRISCECFNWICRGSTRLPDDYLFWCSIAECAVSLKKKKKIFNF